jgi:hexosaminidase
VFPQPYSIVTEGAGAGCLSLTSDASFTAAFGSDPGGDGAALLTSAIARTTAQMQPCAAAGADSACSKVSALKLSVINGSTPLSAGIDESYNLTVTAGAAQLHSPTVWGALHGLQSFSQLFGDSACHCAATAVTIVDQPRFPWRGFMVDSGRQWIPLPLIFATVDAMAYAKMNVLHWFVPPAPLQTRLTPQFNSFCMIV